MKTNYFEDSQGNKSSTRLLGFIVVIWALVFSTAVFFSAPKEGVMIRVAAASSIFTALAGQALLWMFQQKNKNENGTRPQ